MKATRILRTALIITLGLAVVSPLTAQELGEELTVYAGHAVFSDPDYDSVALIEFPFSLTRHQFEFFRPAEADSFLYARVFAQVDLMNSMGLVVDSASTYFSLRVRTGQEARREGIKLFNKLMLFAAPGVYTARVTAIDAVSKRTGKAFIDGVIVEPAREGQLSVGGPMMAFSISPVSDSTRVNMRLVKNGFLIVPNPVGIYSVDDTAMYSYCEVYNVAASNDSPDNESSGFYLTYELLNRSDSLLRGLGTRKIRRKGATVAFGESFDIADWHAGAYKLRVVASNLTRDVADTSVVPLAIVSPQTAQIAAANRIQKSDPYNELSLQERVHLVWYLLTPKQQATLENLSADGKANFLAQYWAEHDSNPATEFNEGRAELVRRFQYANQNFSLNEAKDDGWLTDRGRIFITYGAPEEIDDRQVPKGGSPAGTNPYQIWYYRTIDEGKWFVFVDEYGNSEYLLRHSNVYGEMYREEWEQWLRSGAIDYSEDM